MLHLYTHREARVGGRGQHLVKEERGSAEEDWTQSQNCKEDGGQMSGSHVSPTYHERLFLRTDQLHSISTGSGIQS